MEVVAPQAPFRVRAGEYEGPFELVLELIEKNKLHISDLSLSQITEEFIAHVKRHEAFPVEMTAEFVAVAATLILIKSKSLLPNLELSQDEEQDIDEFKRRLMMYEQTREAAKELSKIFGRSVLIQREQGEPEPYFAPSQDLSTTSLTLALTRVLTETQKEEELAQVSVRSTVTIEEMMERLYTRVTQALSMSFKEFSKDAKEKVEVIVSFLALLELMKDGKLGADQDEHFGDIHIQSSDTAVPHYG